MAKLSLKDLSIKDKKVLMRVDFNVPMDAHGNITDDTRIKAALPSIQYLLSQKGALILMSHLGRPNGKTDPQFSLAPCAQHLSKLLGQPVQMAPDCIGEKTEALARALKPGEILMLENLRFHPAEEEPEKDPSFSKQLAAFADFYVNDAFGTAHRAHASTVEITRYFPGKAAAGFLLEKEIHFLGEALLHPKRPFYAIIGGAKVSTKLNVMRALLGRCDALLVGGGMTYTFLKAQGIPIGKSICEEKMIPEAKKIMETSKNITLPVDSLIANRLEANAEIKHIQNAEGISDGWYGVDIGADTLKIYAEKLQNAATVFWNGPLGIFEIPPFSQGTYAMAHLLANLSAITIVGGGESVAAVESAGVSSQFSHISTGGGATLEYLEKGKLPGIEALSEKIT